MKSNIVQKTHNPLLHRDELVLSVPSEKTLSRKELREKIAVQLNADIEKVSIQKILQPFGAKEMQVHVRVYDSKETLEKTELPQIVFRNRGEKRKPKKKEPKVKTAKKQR
ncbi:MAG: hypothetical protein J4215_06095 [Candidatus Diapherotrites archaeon]|uniref:Small ribosomal subunit protein eS24 n=1 Tax=Candidatus Iainarchaeum sp. TaxID=3101447 RepID=A0A8T4L671_9ARCH|nr:hypothetical protein [Candidatus Diapherotrites archaeon]